MKNEFRQLPGVDSLLQHESIKALESDFPHDTIVSIIRRCLDEHRKAIGSGKQPPDMDKIAQEISLQLKSLMTPGLRPVINATGVILHTNLGRAPLSREALSEMRRVSAGYNNVEIDIDSGKRGSRQVHLESFLRELTGAEAALVVNNCAAAVLLGLTAIARRKEVIVSRGQSVEIGGGFRVPEVMRQSGARLIEVGTTNCTYSRDFEQAITPGTAALLRVHSSNFRVVGFTNNVTLAEITALGRKHNIPVLDDLGSGCLIDTGRFGLAPEPLVQESLKLGVDLAFFSGDKLLGGPQAGIIVGKRDLVDRLKKHPLARAVRIDKVRIAGLAATLIHYLRGEALSQIPVWIMISAPLKQIEDRAAAWARQMGQHAQVIDGESMVGGGSLPGETLPTKLAAIKGSSRNPVETIARRLRTQSVPVIGRISGNVLLLDPRTVMPEEDPDIRKALDKLAESWQ